MAMASANGDPCLRDSLLEVADEFDAEAARLDGVTDQRGDPQEISGPQSSGASGPARSSSSGPPERTLGAFVVGA
jgi:hypothetical protein